MTGMGKGETCRDIRRARLACSTGTREIRVRLSRQATQTPTSFLFPPGVSPTHPCNTHQRVPALVTGCRVGTRWNRESESASQKL